MLNSCVKAVCKLSLTMCMYHQVYAQYPHLRTQKYSICNLYSFCTQNMFIALHKFFIIFLSVILEFYAKSTNSTKTIILLSK